MYRLIFGKKSLEELNKLEKEIKERIWKKLQLCKENPFRFVEKLTEIGGFKLRVGDYTENKVFCLTNFRQTRSS